MSDTLELTLESGDITDSQADLVMLKHAQGFYGADDVVARRLTQAGVAHSQLEVPPGQHRFIETRKSMPAPLALFVGTPPLGQLGYHEIRLLAGRALKALEDRPEVQTIVCTVHGTAFGLDEDESVLAQVGGFIDAFQRGLGKSQLKRIVIVEKHAGRARRMKIALEDSLEGNSDVTPIPHGFRIARSAAFVQSKALSSAGGESTAKPHAFVAMPFAASMDDVFHHGVLGPVRATGLLCERVDQEVFNALVISRIKERIDSAKVVIADLSGASPNVYLEVGYAWGKGRPTILCVRDVEDLRFDVAASHCIVYSSIRDLESLLTRELEHL